MGKPLYATEIGSHHAKQIHRRCAQASWKLWLNQTNMHQHDPTPQ